MVVESLARHTFPDLGTEGWQCSSASEHEMENSVDSQDGPNRTAPSPPLGSPGQGMFRRQPRQNPFFLAREGCIWRGGNAQPQKPVSYNGVLNTAFSSHAVKKDISFLFMGIGELITHSFQDASMRSLMRSCHVALQRLLDGLRLEVNVA